MEDNKKILAELKEITSWLKWIFAILCGVWAAVIVM